MGKGNGKYQVAAKEALQNVSIGKPVFHGGLTVFPLQFQHEATALDHIPLEDALQSGAVEITEVSESGNVPELLFVNNGDRSYLS